MKKGIKAEGLEEVAKAIIQTKFKKSMTLSQVMNKFYSIMRKHGIRKTTKVGNGYQGANFEWTICFELFQKQVESYFNWENMFTVPKDLHNY